MNTAGVHRITRAAVDWRHPHELLYKWVSTMHYKEISTHRRVRQDVGIAMDSQSSVRTNRSPPTTPCRRSQIESHAHAPVVHTQLTPN
mmetsp:Transcript_22250/g.63490  ORF Transcript_22250/g.63490 Transcript_22250/m.63490 type:complete len:88 (+) Transcript_22250:206-469(+)